MSKDSVEQFIAYLKKQWSSKDMAAYIDHLDTPRHRTTNIAEGWNNGLQASFHSKRYTKIILGRDPLLSDLVTVLRQKLDVARVDSEAVTRGSALSPTTPKATRESLDRVSTIRHMFLA